MNADNGGRPSGDALSMWTVYDRPSDYPESFVAREWIIARGPAEIIITDHVIVSGSLETVRSALMRKGLHRLERMAGDDRAILETWL